MPPRPPRYANSAQHLAVELRLARMQRQRRLRLAAWCVSVAVVATVLVLAGHSAVSRGAGHPSAAGVRPVSADGSPLPSNDIETEPLVGSPNTVAGSTQGPGTGGSHAGAPPQTSAAIVAENRKPGTSSWKLTQPSTAHQIEGYADQVSIVAGQPVTLYVSTTAPTFDADVYRMGWYQGLGARLVATSEANAGMVQKAATVTPRIYMVEARWLPSVTLDTTTWPPGDYLFKLVASTGEESYIPLTVRDDTSTAAFAVINAVTTWQAYNLWGGYDLYQGSNGSSLTRSRVVSFDRPYSISHGAADFLGLEYPFVSLVESLGLDVTYLTDIDLQTPSNPLPVHKAAFSLGHDEYYSMQMRQNLSDARDQGVNLAFLGANAIYRHIRFDASPLGPDRHEICYKNAGEDPLYGKDNADVTVNWRDAPTSDPESQLIGDYYQCNPVLADMVIADPRSWLFAGTGVTEGQHLPGVVSSEYDRYDPDVPGPPDVEILTHSPLVCHGQADYSDATYYTAPSGAGVFASGAIAFVGNINLHCHPDGCNGQILGRVLENLLTVYGAGPAGRSHPSEPSESGVVSQPPKLASYGNMQFNGGPTIGNSPNAIGGD